MKRRSVLRESVLMMTDNNWERHETGSNKGHSLLLCKKQLQQLKLNPTCLLSMKSLSRKERGGWGGQGSKGDKENNETAIGADSTQSLFPQN